MGKSNNDLYYYNSDINELFRDLFLFLDGVGYNWHPVIPEQLVKLRKEGRAFRRLDQYFGLGIQVDFAHLEAEGLSYDLLEKLEPLRLAISRLGRYYVPHNHWSSHPVSADQYVHFGQESVFLTYQLYRYWSELKGKRILDLGCSAGALTLELGQIASEVLGVDRSERAVEWAWASASAQKSKNTSFIQWDIREAKVHPEISNNDWDAAVFNPPMVIPRKNELLPHRDGGEFGLEIPFLFLDFSERWLKPFGDVYCLMTNPIRHGKSLLFDLLKTRTWDLVDKVCINHRFNHQLYREEQYRENEIERVELHFVHLRKRA